MVRQCHPDVEGGTSEKFRDLQAAYETLTDAAARARYDRTLEAPVGGHDGGRAWTTWAGAAHGEILLSPEEARAGGALPLEIPVRNPCRDCAGTGGTDWI